MELFVKKDSIVREIWGKSDTVLLIFAGASGEFALNKAVDWLYFTGKLPSDPLGRLFSTVEYAKKIVFAPTEHANASIDLLRKIHGGVEENRGMKIPDWAYRDVLFMLIHYSIASYELLERRMSHDEKEELYNVFYRMGSRMEIPELPQDYKQWLAVREQHLKENLKQSKYTFDLYKQYKKYLGFFRYRILIESQKLVVPKHAKKLLFLNDYSVLSAIIPLYKLSRFFKLDSLLKNMLLPPEYKTQIMPLDIHKA